MKRLILLIAFISLYSCSEKKAEPEPSSKPVAQPAVAKPEPVHSSKTSEISDTVTLSFGKKSAHVCRNKSDLDLMIKYLAAKDNYGLNELISRGAILFVPNETKAIYLGAVGFGVREVRIISGKYAGTAGFVVKEAVHSL